MQSPGNTNKQVILACLLTGQFDVNRNRTLPTDDFELVRSWAMSIQRTGLHGILFHNTFSEETQKKYSNENLSFVRVDNTTTLNANVYRYFVYLEYLQKEGLHFTDVFATDVSDVAVVANPFVDPFYIDQPASIFCGDEPKTLANSWMREHSTHLRNTVPNFAEYEQKYAGAPLLNCGIIGGKTNHFINFLEKLCAVHQAYNMHNDSAYTGDMGAFNFVMRTQFEHQLKHGFPINTLFKENQIDRQDCWFRHK